MDQARAQYLFQSVKKIPIDGWTAVELLGYGKSAAVFKAQKDNQFAALKIFDNELVEQFGRTTQIARIERELTLVGKSIPNLVKILGGGESQPDKYLYVLMEFLEGSPLSSVLSAVPRDEISSILSQVARAAKSLEDHGLVHRDIKPDNVIISSDFKVACLADLGVCRPLVGSDLTDQAHKEFIGTLRYSSPEFLFRIEKDDKEGWQALTFYQIGAVLHDLIMRTRIFAGLDSPYARLVEAVKNDQPQITASDVPAELVLLAKNCLLKSPERRLSLVSWESFLNFDQHKPKIGLVASRVKKRLAHAVLTNSESREKLEESWENNRRFEELAAQVGTQIHLESVSVDAFPPFEVRSASNVEMKSVLVEIRLSKSQVHGLPEHCAILFEISVEDLKERVVKICCGCRTHVDADEAIMVPEIRHKISVYEGVYDGTLSGQRIQESLYVVLDAMQGHLEKAGCEPGWIALGS